MKDCQNQDWPKVSRELHGQHIMYDPTKCPERLATISISVTSFPEVSVLIGEEKRDPVYEAVTTSRKLSFVGICLLNKPYKWVE